MTALLNQYDLGIELGKKIFMEAFQAIALEHVAYIHEEGNTGYSIEALEHVWDLVTVRVHEFPKWFRKPDNLALNQFE